MRKLLLPVIASLLLTSTAQAQDTKPACTVVESGYAFFVDADNAWDESRTVEIRKCGDAHELVLLDTKTKAVLSQTAVGSPKGEEAWFLDGLTCRTKGQKKTKKFASKAVLGNLELHLEKPKKGLREVWQVSEKKGKWEKVKVSTVRCEGDEP